MQVPSGMQEQFQDCLCIHGHCLCYSCSNNKMSCDFINYLVSTECVVCHEQSLCVFVCVCVCGYNSSSVFGVLTV